MRVRKRLLVRDATLLGMGERGYGIADYGGMVASPGYEHQLVQSVLGSLRNGRSWDLIDLQQLPESPLVDAVLHEVRSAGLRWMVRRQNLCNVIALPATWADYKTQVSASTRAWLERRPRQTNRELGSQVELVERGSVIEEYDTMRRFQAQRHGSQPRELEERIRRVMTAWLPAAHERGWLRMFRLRGKSATLGVLLGYEFEGTYYVHSSAFDPHPQVARFSIGASLHSHALQWSIERSLKRFDLLRGNYSYKEKLGGESRSNFRLLVFRHPWQGLALEAALRLRSRLRGQSPWLATPA